MIEAAGRPAAAVPSAPSLRDLDKFTPILDHCGASYGLSYRAVLERLRAAIEGTEAGA